LTPKGDFDLGTAPQRRIESDHGGLSVFECEAPQEIVTVLRTSEGQWFVVTELGVETRSNDLLDQIARYEHGEITLSAGSEGAEVVVRDLENRQVRLGLPELRVL
jgi:hypothetical protein